MQIGTQTETLKIRLKMKAMKPFRKCKTEVRSSGNSESIEQKLKCYLGKQNSNDTSIYRSRER